MPTSSMAYIIATTRGREASGAISVASARPAVCVVCSPTPTKRIARPVPRWAVQTGQWLSPDSRIRAKGMIDRPLNWARVPSQIYGTLRQPSTERWVSDLNPTRARKGANNNGSATIRATSHAPTPSSTIMTRFSVPIRSAMHMPTDT